MVFIDRGALIFDLVTRLSQVLNSKDVDVNSVSSTIVQRLIDCCLSLKGNYRHLNSLEQSTLTLLLGLSVRHESIRARVYPAALQLLLTIESDPAFWSDKFESDFGKTLVIHVLKCARLVGSDTEERIVASKIVAQMKLLSDKIIPDEDSLHLAIVRGVLEAIGSSDANWIPWAHTVMAISKKVGYLATPFDKPWSIFVASASLSAGSKLMQQYAAQPTRDSKMTITIGTLVADLVEVAASVLGSSHCRDLELKRGAVFAMSVCVGLVPLHRESTFQQGIKLLKSLRFLGIGAVVEFDSRSTSFASEFIYDEEDYDDVTVFIGEITEDMKSAIGVIKALKVAVVPTKVASAHDHIFLSMLAQQLSRACIYMYVKGRLHETGGEKSPNDDVVPSDVLRNFGNVVFDVLKEELNIVGFEKSVCKRFFQVVFEYCFCAAEYSGLHAQALEAVAGSDSASVPVKGTPSVTSLGSTTSKPVITESSYINCFRMIGLVGNAVESLKIGDVSSFVYSGLLDLLARASKIPPLTGVISVQLGRLALSSSTADSPVITEAAADQDEDSFLDLVIETLISSYTRAFAQAKYVTAGGAVAIEGVDGADLEGAFAATGTSAILSGIAAGLETVVQGLLDRKDWIRLTGIRQSLMETFIVTSAAVYDKTSRLSESALLKVMSLSNSGVVENTAALLGTLLPPLAASFSLSSSTGTHAGAESLTLSPSALKSLDDPASAFASFSVSDLSKYRDLWYNLVLFRLKENSAWVAHPEWRKAIQQVASRCPPLLLGLGAGSVVFLDKELLHNPVLKHVVGRGERNDGSFSKALRGVAKFNVDSLSPGQAIFAGSVQLLEALRAGGSLDMRPILLYLSDPGVDSSPTLREAMKAIANHVFSVYIEAVVSRLREFSTNEGEISNVQNVSSFLELRAIIGQVFEFIVARCSHRHAVVREMSLQFVAQMVDRLPWLMWSSTSITVLLDTVQLLVEQDQSVQSTQGSFPSLAESDAAAGTAELVSDDAYQFNLKSLAPVMHDKDRVGIALLSADALPDDAKVITAAAQPLLEMAYSWLFAGMRKVPVELSAVLQEYILKDNKSTTQSSAMHLGISLAKEAATNKVPTFHQTPASSVGRQPLAAIRASAAAKIAAQLPQEAKPKAAYGADLAVSFAFELAIKSRFLGEIRGMMLAGSPENTTAILPLAEEIKGNLGSLLHKQGINWSSASDGEVDILVEAMWRCAAVAHILITGHMTPEDDVVVMRTIGMLASVTSHCFCTQTIDCITAVFRWLVAGSTSTKLRRIITTEACGVMLNSARSGLGLWAPSAQDAASKPSAEIHHNHELHADSKNSLLEPGTYATRVAHSKGSSSADAQDPLSQEVQHIPQGPNGTDPRVHETLIEFFLHLLETDSFNVSLIAMIVCFSGLISTGECGGAAISRSHRAVSAHFRLLCLGMRLLRRSLSVPGAITGPARRVLREKILASALNHFDFSPLWTDLKPSAGHAIEAFAALWEFYVLLLDETKVWGAEYPAASREVVSEGTPVAGTINERTAAAAKFLSQGRAAGSSAAINFLRHAIGNEVGIPEYSILPNTVLAPHAELGVFSPSTADSKPSARLANVASSHVDASTSTGPSRIFSGLLCLLRMLFLQELDRLAAWAGEIKEGDKFSLKESVLALVTPAIRRVAAADYKILFKDSKAYKLAVRAAWAYSPTLALRLRDRYAAAAANDGKRKGLSTLCALVIANPLSLRHSWEGLSTFLAALDNPTRGSKDADDIARYLMLWAPAPVHVVIDTLNRNGVALRKSLPGAVTHEQHLHIFPGVVRYCLRSLSVTDPVVIRFFIPQLIQLLRRDRFGSLADLLLEIASSSALVCHKLVWLLDAEVAPEDYYKKNASPSRRRLTHGHCNSLQGQDPLPAIAQGLLTRIRSSLSPGALNFLDEETQFFNFITNISAKLKTVKDKDQHGLVITDSLKQLSFTTGRIYMPTVPTRLIVGIDYESAAPLQSAAKCPFILVFKTTSWEGPDSVNLPPPEAYSHRIEVLAPQSLSPVSGAESFVGANLPRSPVGGGGGGGEATAEKKYQEREEETSPLIITPVNLTSKKSPRGIGKKGGMFTIPKKLRFDLADDVTVAKGEGEDEKPDGSVAAAGGGKEVSVISSDDIAVDIPLPRPNVSTLVVPKIMSIGQSTGGKNVLNLDNIDAEYLGEGELKSDYGSGSGSGFGSGSGSAYKAGGSPGSTISEGTGSTTSTARSLRRGFQRWAPKELVSSLLTNRVLDSPEKGGAYPLHDSSETNDACVFKVYDDCRQDALIIQVIRILRDEFVGAGLPLFVLPYSIIPTRTGEDKALGGILQVIPNVKSRDQIGKAGARNLIEYFVRQFGSEGSFSFKQAQHAFASSLAGYAIVCYLLSIKDRHNGNLLIDDQGHIIHIDYGFTLGISPGGNLGFETAAFKLTSEMISLLGGVHSEIFASFVDMVIRGFLVAREAVEPILDVVCALADSGLPNFVHKADNLEKLRARFVPEMTATEAAKYMRDKVFDAVDKWTTNAYDSVQKVQNNIY